VQSKIFLRISPFGVDDGLGVVAVSLRREKLVDSGSAAGKSDTTAGSTYQYRVIVRTSELATRRGSILEDCIVCIPSSSAAPEHLLTLQLGDINVTYSDENLSPSDLSFFGPLGEKFSLCTAFNNK